MLAVRFTLKGGNCLMTRRYDSDIAAWDAYNRYGWVNPEVEQVEILDCDFDFVLAVKYNMRIKKHYTVTCKGTTHTYFDLAEALEDQRNLECFFGVREVQFKTVNGEEV